MACFTTSPYGITGCTDANTYTPTATSVDFQMEAGSNPAGVTYNYTACLQKYDSYDGWINWSCKSGSFSRKTSVMAFSLTSPNAPAGTYRMMVNFSAGAAVVPFSAVTSTFIVQ